MTQTHTHTEKRLNWKFQKEFRRGKKKKGKKKKKTMPKGKLPIQIYKLRVNEELDVFVKDKITFMCIFYSTNKIQSRW